MKRRRGKNGGENDNESQCIHLSVSSQETVSDRITSINIRIFGITS